MSLTSNRDAERLEGVLDSFRREIADYDGQGHGPESGWSAEFLGGRMGVLLGIIEEVVDLHALRRYDGDGFTVFRCRECGWNWPCPTLLAIAGEP